MESVRLWIVAVATVGMATCVTAAINDTPKTQIDMDTRQSQMKYLERYHYLKQDSANSAMQQLSQEQAFQQAVRHFQRIVDLPQTGNVDAATKHMMEQPRCGLPDVPDELPGDQLSNETATTPHREKRYVTVSNVNGEGFQQSTIRWQLVNTQSASVTYSSARDAVVEAFRIWAAVTPLTFQEVSSYSDIAISFQARQHGDGADFDGQGGVLAHALLPAYNSAWDYVPVHHDRDERWTISQGGTDFLQVVCHEIGHALGLGHSEVSSAVMAPVYSYRHSFQLTQDDIRGIQSIYGAPEEEDGTDDGGEEAGEEPPLGATSRFCSEAGLDAITFDGGSNVYIFKGTEYVRVGGGQIAPGYPRSIQDGFNGQLPDNLDAMLYIPERRVWVYCGIRYRGRCYWILKNYSSINYAFKGEDLYEHMNNGFQNAGTVSSVFPGVPSDIDAAFYGTDNHIYFVKGSQYWKLTSVLGELPGYPQALSAPTSPFRRLQEQGVTSLDGAMLAYTGGQWVNYVVSGDTMYQLATATAAVSRVGSVMYDLYGCTVLNLGGEPREQITDLILDDTSAPDMHPLYVDVREDGSIMDSEDVMEAEKLLYSSGGAPIHSAPYLCVMYACVLALYKLF